MRKRKTTTLNYPNERDFNKKKKLLAPYLHEACKGQDSKHSQGEQRL